MDDVAPALTGSDLLHLNGQCFVGDGGVLGVALNAGSLVHLQRAGAATHWLLPVEDAAIADAAVSLPGNIFWLCSRPPAQVLGQLVEDFRGAWVEGDSIIINLDGRPRRRRMKRPPHPSFTLAYLARTVANVWTGSPSACDAPTHLENANAAERIAA